MQAFQAFLAAYNLQLAAARLAILVVVGGIALLASWLIGPAMGLGVVAIDGNMPPLFSRHNKNGCSGGRVDPASRDRHDHLAGIRFHSRRQHRILDYVGFDRDFCCASRICSSLPR